MESLALLVVRAFEAYAVVGALFAVLFVSVGIGRVDPSAASAGWGFRALVAPGCAALWPVLLMRWIIGGKLLKPERVSAGGTSVRVVLLFLGGVQLVSIGELGDYIGRIFRETKGRPLYVVARRVKFEAAERTASGPGRRSVPATTREPAP